MRPDRRVMITGMGIICSVGADIAAFGESLAAMRSGFAPYDSPFLAAAATVRDFDFRSMPMPETISPEIKSQAVRLTRRSGVPIQTTVAAALQAWDQAKLQDTDGEQTAILTAGSNLFQGSLFEIYRKAAEKPEFVSPSYAVQQFDTNINGILSELFGIHGEGMSIGGASASGNVCLVQGMRLIRSGAAEVCMCVAPMYDFSPAELSAFSNLQAIGDYSKQKPEEACRPFDRGHHGMVPGQASVCLVLEAGEHARARGQETLAELAGGALVLDGNHLPDANAEGEARAMRKAMEDAKITPDEVDYINAHATSTPGGDTAEAEAILRIAGEHRNRIWVNSTKSLIGHCMFSAGMAEAAAVVCQIRGGYIHGTRNLTDPITDQLRFAQTTEQGQKIRCALSNSFGFGGINASIVIRNTETP